MSPSSDPVHRIPGRVLAVLLVVIPLTLGTAALARAYVLYDPVTSNSVTPTATAGPSAALAATTSSAATAAPTSTAIATSTPVAMTTTPAAVAPLSDTYSEIRGGGGGHNVVQVRNQTDGHLMARGRVQVNHIPAPAVSPLNYAYAYGSCTGCETFAVALQVNLYDQAATQVTPQNAAVAVNFQCNGCTTAAWAIQYDYPVADPDHVPDDVASLVRQMNQQLRAIDQGGMTLDQAEAQINAVLNQFQGLAGYLHAQRQQTTDASSLFQPTPLPTTTPSSTPSAGTSSTTSGAPAVSTGASPAATATSGPVAATETPTASAGASVTASPAATSGPATPPSPSPTATPTAS